MLLLVPHYPDFLITSCIHAFENYVQSTVLYVLRSQLPVNFRSEPFTSESQPATTSAKKSLVEKRPLKGNLKNLHDKAMTLFQSQLLKKMLE